MRRAGLAFLSFVLFLLLLFAYVLWANRPVPYVKPPYHPPKDNAWDYYERALKMPSAYVYWFPDPEELYSEPNPPENVRKMEAARLGLGRTCCLPPEDPLKPGIGGVGYDSFTHMAPIFAREGAALAHRGQLRKAVDAYLDGMYLAADIGHGGETRYLTAQNMNSMCAIPLKALISRLDAEQCEHAMKRLVEIGRRRATVREALISEGRLATFVLGAGYTVVRPQDLLTTLNPSVYSDMRIGGKRIGVLGWLRFVASDKHRAAAAACRYYDQLAAESAKPYCSRKAPSEPDSFVAKASSFSAYASATTSVFLESSAHDQALDRMLSIRLALRAYYLRNGQYPERLSLGVSRYLTRSGLEDPFNARPFHYHRSRNGYVLYSVGPDGRDDGGKPLVELTGAKDKGDVVGWPEENW